MAVTSQVTNGPYVLQNTTGHGAQLFRMALSSLLGSGGGVVGSGDYAVTQVGSGTTFAVDVAIGKAWVEGTSTTAQSQYFVYNDATVSVAVGAHSAFNRIDSIVLQVEDQAYAGSSNLAQIVDIPGTVANTAPTLPASCLLLGNISILSTNTTGITTADITDERVFVPGANAVTYGGDAGALVGSPQGKGGTGTILQYGAAAPTLTGGSEATITFPEPFPNSVGSVLIQSYAAAGGILYSAEVISTTTSGFTFAGFSGTALAGAIVFTCDWIAVGS